MTENLLIRSPRLDVALVWSSAIKLPEFTSCPFTLINNCKALILQIYQNQKISYNHETLVPTPIIKPDGYSNDVNLAMHLAFIIKLAEDNARDPVLFAEYLLEANNLISPQTPKAPSTKPATIKRHALAKEAKAEIAKFMKIKYPNAETAEYSILIDVISHLNSLDWFENTFEQSSIARWIREVCSSKTRGRPSTKNVVSRQKK